MALKDYFESDLDIFFNISEFGTEHTIDGEKKIIQLDEQKLEELSQSKFQGISAGEILYYIPVSSLSEKPKELSTQDFDGRLMYIKYVGEENGVYVVTLSQNLGE